MKIFNRLSRSRRVSMMFCGACLLWTGATSVASEPLLRHVAVAPLVVEAQSLEGVPTEAAQPERVQFLEKQIAQHVQRWLSKRRLAARQPIVSGTIRLPVSMPRDLPSWRKLFAKERFANVRLTMQLADGTKIESAAELDGKEINLTKRLRQ